MSDKARIRIAATVTALFLAGISAAGLATHGGQPQPAPTTTTPSTATQARTAPPDVPATGDDRYEGSEDGD
jgi:hypothetical protein